MRKHIWIALAAALLLAGVPAATAVHTAVPATGTWHSTRHSPRQPHGSATYASGPAGDVLLLTHGQQISAWKDLHRRLRDQYGPTGFSTMPGWGIPPGVSVRPMTGQAGRDVPALRPYDFAMVQGRLLIVNPSDGIVAEVIRAHRAGWSTIASI